jgi:1-deoxy-D-xylulose-5-phosphate reductoisomerase
MKRIVVLGSTGSIGVSALSVMAEHPDRFAVVALAAATNGDRLVAQARHFLPEVVAIEDERQHAQVARALESLPVRVLSGRAGVMDVARWPTGERVVSAIVGFAGLAPTLAAIQAGKDVALANKESLVVGGQYLMEEVRRTGVALLPVDSEHSAVWQVFRDPERVHRVLLTASGGPFLGWSREQLASVTAAQALAHPTWVMGRKVTVDSSTLMNKGFEVIEAHWLFGLPPERIDVVVHPESTVHSLVEYVDGSVLAQLGTPDMRTPIALALAWPDRVAVDVPRLDLVALGRLTFREPDRALFPCLDLAYHALRCGGTAPAILNGANEIAVDAFLCGRLTFTGIAALVEAVLSSVSVVPALSMDVLQQADRDARASAQAWVARKGL